MPASLPAAGLVWASNNRALVELSAVAGTELQPELVCLGDSKCADILLCRPLPRCFSGVLAAAAFLMSSLIAGSAALATTPIRPERFVADWLERFNKQLATSSSDSLEGLRTQLRAVIDFDAFAERTLPSKWKILSANERRDFSTALRALIESHFMSAPKEVLVKSRIVVKNGTVTGDTAAIQGVVKRKDVDLEIVLRLRQNATKWRAYDIFINELSLADDYKRQFDRFLEKKTIAALTDKLYARAAANKTRGTDKVSAKQAAARPAAP